MKEYTIYFDRKPIEADILIYAIPYRYNISVDNKIAIDAEAKAGLKRLRLLSELDGSKLSDIDGMTLDDLDYVTIQ